MSLYLKINTYISYIVPLTHKHFQKIKALSNADNTVYRKKVICLYLFKDLHII